MFLKLIFTLTGFCANRKPRSRASADNARFFAYAGLFQSSNGDLPRYRGNTEEPIKNSSTARAH
jgi:hypothetical protein